MKTILTAASLLLLTAFSTAQVSNAKTETVKISGNCGMCKSTIEKAGNKKKLYKTDWNEDTKMATITYDAQKTNADAVLKQIALAGYDSEKYLAPAEAYDALPGCCKYERENKHAAKDTSVPADGNNAHQHGNETTAPAADHNDHQHETATAETGKASQLKFVFDNYFSLKDALVKTDATTAAAKAKELSAALNTVKMESLKADEHTAWMKLEKDLKMNAEHIGGTNDIEHQREHFMALSKDMYELIKASKTVETVYYQFCPMANDGKGANWLSKENTIKNPYYGSQMLSCGKTVETIKQ